MTVWTVPREWPGADCFIVAGGTSVATQAVSRLQGRRVIAVNSSYLTAPSAAFVFSMDARWLRQHMAALKRFPGRVVTCSERALWPEMLVLAKKSPPGLSSDPGAVMGRRTSLTGAINLAVHLGAARIVLLGADGGPGANGRTHHHAPHPWKNKPGCWDEQHDDLVTIVEPLRALGIEVWNASPGTRWTDLWPVMTLTEALDRIDAMVAAVA